MSPFVLKMVIRISVVAGFFLLVLLWKAIRPSKVTGTISKHQKLIRNTVIGLLVMFVLVFLFNEFGDKYVYKLFGPDPEFKKKLDAVASFVDGNRERIDAADRKLDSLTTLVKRDGWLPEGELVGNAKTDGVLLFWAERLRGEEFDNFEVFESDLDLLNQLVEFAADAENIAAIPIEELNDVLTKFEAPFVIVASLHAVKNPDPAAGRRGTVEFGVAVVETQSGRLVAYGHGQSTNNESLYLKAKSTILMEDLWKQTQTAVRSLANQLTQKMK